MSCAGYRRDLVERALGAPIRGEAEAHLASCAACRAELARLNALEVRIEDELGALLAAEPSPGLVPGVRRCLERRREVRARRLPWLAAAAAAALAIVALGVRFVGRPAAAPPPAVAPRQALVVPPSPALAPAKVREARPPSRRLVRAEPAQPQGPEVLVPRDQEELLRRLVRATEDQPLAIARATAGSSASDLAQIYVPPIEVRPLALETNEVKPLQMENGEGAS